MCIISVTSYALQWGATSTGDKLFYSYVRAAGYHSASTIDGGSVIWVDFDSPKSVDLNATYIEVSFRTDSGWIRTAGCQPMGFDTGGCRLWTNNDDKKIMMQSGYMKLDFNLKMKDANKEKIHLKLRKRHAFSGAIEVLVDTDLYIKGASCLAETDPIWNVGSFTKGIREEKNFNFSVQGVGNSIGYLEFESNDLNDYTMALGGNGPKLRFYEGFSSNGLSSKNCKIPTSNKMCTIAPKLGDTLNISGSANATDSPPGSFTSTLKATLTCD